MCDLLHFVSWKKIVASTSNNNNLRVYDRFLGVGGIHGAPWTFRELFISSIRRVGLKKKKLHLHYSLNELWHRRRYSLGANNKVAQNLSFSKICQSFKCFDIKMSINLYFVLTKWYFFPEQIEPLFWKNYISQYSCTSFCILEHGTTVFVLSRSNSNKRQFMSLSV